MDKSKLYNRLILALILIVAVVLRFYNFSDIPYTQDEYSALFRLEFDGFFNIIEYGVRTDTHPAGVQLFMYYWGELFGHKPWAMKLPFAIFGVISVYITYLLGKKWFNETVGLLSASIIATVQYTVMYSVIARPYSSGMFLCLLTVLFWTNIIKHPQKKFYLNALLYIVSSAMCAYNHHFTLMFAFILGVAGVFFVDRKLLLKYILCGVLIFVLYIPHLSIFKLQLSQGGIGGWLAKPKNDFIIDYLRYIFHFSFVFMSAIILIIISGFFIKGIDKEKKAYIAKYALFLSLFAIPYLISFFYSKYVNAVLQFSVLIFGFPFLVIFMFGHFKELKVKWNLIFVSVILTLSILTLVFDRSHYKLFYGSANRDVLVNHDKFKSDNTLSIGNIYKKTAHFNGALLDIDSNILKFDFDAPHELKSFLEERVDEYDSLYYGFQVRKKPWAIPIIQSYYPNLTWSEYYHDGSAYLFKKGTSSVNYLDQNDFDSIKKLGYSELNPANIKETICLNKGKSYLLDNGARSIVYTKDISSLKLDPFKFIDVNVGIHADSLVSESSIDCWIELNGEIIDYNSLPMNKLFDWDKFKGGWTQIQHTLPLRKKYKSGKIVLKVRVRRNPAEVFNIDNFDISIRDENPYIYKLYQKL